MTAKRQLETLLFLCVLLLIKATTAIIYIHHLLTTGPQHYYYLPNIAPIQVFAATLTRMSTFIIEEWENKPVRINGVCCILLCNMCALFKFHFCAILAFMPAYNNVSNVLKHNITFLTPLVVWLHYRTPQHYTIMAMISFSHLY